MKRYVIGLHSWGRNVGHTIVRVNTIREAWAVIRKRQLFDKGEPYIATPRFQMFIWPSRFGGYRFGGSVALLKKGQRK